MARAVAFSRENPRSSNMLLSLRLRTFLLTFCRGFGVFPLFDCFHPVPCYFDVALRRLIRLFRKAVQDVNPSGMQSV
jgi:hypothetical protein